MKKLEQITGMKSTEEARAYEQLRTSIASVRADITTVARLHALLHEFEVIGGSVDTIQKEDLRRISTAYFQTYEDMALTVYDQILASSIQETTAQ